MSVWGGRKAQAVRAYWADQITAAWVAGMPVQCGALVCRYPSRSLGPGSSWDVGHSTAVVDDPARVWDPANHRPEHVRCNRADGQAIARRRRGAKRERAWL